MTLNRLTKHDVRPGDVLRFQTGGDSYVVLRVIPSVRGGVSFTIQDMETRQVIYAYPSSQLYGAVIEKA